MDTLIPVEAELSVIGACLNSPDAVIFANETAKPADFGTPVHGWLAEAIWGCLNDRNAPTLPAIITRLKTNGRWSVSGGAAQAVTMADIDKAREYASQADVEYIRNNARIVADMATRRRGKKAMQDLSAAFADTTKPLDEVQSIVNLTTSLAFEQSGTRSPDLASIAKLENERIDRLEEGQTPGLTCGLPWLDDLTGGFLPGETWVLAAPYKQRKTTLALNMVLHAAQANGGITILTVGDSSRDTTYRKLLAMVFNQIMIEEGDEGQVPSSKSLQFGLNSPHYQELRRRAEARLTAYNIRLYDAVDKIGDLSHAEKVIRRDVALYGTQLVVYDHAQGCYAGKTDYERGVLFSSWLQRQAGELGICCFALSQVSEETIRRDDSGDYSPGTKGGGALPAMANVLLKVKYVEPTITVELKLSRDSGMGDTVPHRCQPTSGLIIA